MNPADSSKGIESDPAYHSHKPGERRLSEDPVVFPEKEGVEASAEEGDL